MSTQAESFQSVHAYAYANMLGHMRTTVILPDELMRQLKQRAQREQTTMTSLLERAVRHYLQEPNVRPESIVLPKPYSAGGLQPGVDLDDSVALNELLDEDLPLEKQR